MFKKTSSLTSRLALGCALAISLQVVSGSFANAADEAPSAKDTTCALPVCDVDAKIEELRVMPRGDSFNFLNKLRVKYKKSKNPAEWENLLSLGEKATSLFTDLEAEDWMIAEAQNLANDAIMGLMKYRTPIELDYLLTMFGKISNENGRFEALKYWSGAIGKIEDRDALSALLQFGGKAHKIVLSIEDSDWVGEEAQRVASLATARLVAMDPAHEGIFAIQPVCSGTACGNYPDMKTMIVMETTTKGGQGLVITFPLGNGGTPAYSFYSAAFRDGPDQVTASSSPAGPASPRPAELKVGFNRQTGEVEGLLRDTRSSTSWKFKGKPVRRVLSIPDKVVQGPAPTLEELPGVYQANVNGTVSQLVIRQTMEGPLYASLVNEHYTLDFKIGSYNPKKAFLSLVYVGANQNMVKVVLKVEKLNGVVNASGFSYTIRNATISPWTLKRTGSVAGDE